MLTKVLNQAVYILLYGILEHKQIRVREPKLWPYQALCTISVPEVALPQEEQLKHMWSSPELPIYAHPLQTYVVSMYFTYIDTTWKLQWFKIFFMCNSNILL